MSNSLPYLAFQWRWALNLFHFARTVVTPNHNLRVNLPGNPLMKWCQFSLPFTFSGTFLFPFKKFLHWCWTADNITGKTKRVPNKLFGISITVSIIRIDVLYRNLGFFLWQWLHGKDLKQENRVSCSKIFRTHAKKITAKLFVWISKNVLELTEIRWTPRATSTI